MLVASSGMKPSSLTPPRTARLRPSITATATPDSARGTEKEDEEEEEEEEAAAAAVVVVVEVEAGARAARLSQRRFPRRPRPWRRRRPAAPGVHRPQRRREEPAARRQGGGRRPHGRAVQELVREAGTARRESEPKRGEGGAREGEGAVEFETVDWIGLDWIGLDWIADERRRDTLCGVRSGRRLEGKRALQMAAGRGQGGVQRGKHALSWEAREQLCT